MNPVFGRHTRRRLRIFEALRARYLHQAYRLDPRLQEDLAAEAAYGATHFDDALFTPELLIELQAMSGWHGHKFRAGGPRIVGAPPSAPQDLSLHLPPRLQGKQSASGGTVIIVPGGLASALYDEGPADPGPIWIDAIALGQGRFGDLKLATYDGPKNERDRNAPEVHIKAERAVPMLYDSLHAALLSCGWTPQIFAYDWRKDMDDDAIAPALKEWIKSEGANQPVHIITHSQGGIVARRALDLLIKDKTISNSDAMACVGNVIQLGPANYGAFVAALAVAGSLKQIPVCRLFPRPSASIQSILSTFTALYQLMPCDDKLAGSLTKTEFDIRQHAFWKPLCAGKIDDDRLERAFPAPNQSWCTDIDTTPFDGKFTVILGSHPFRKTPGGVGFHNGELVVNHHYDFEHGDGWVPDAFAILENNPAYRAQATGHIRLPMAARVISAVLDILNGDAPDLHRVA